MTEESCAAAEEKLGHRQRVRPRESEGEVMEIRGLADRLCSGVQPRSGDAAVDFAHLRHLDGFDPHCMLQ